MSTQASTSGTTLFGYGHTSGARPSRSVVWDPDWVYITATARSARCDQGPLIVLGDPAAGRGLHLTWMQSFALWFVDGEP